MTIFAAARSMTVYVSTASEVGWTFSCVKAACHCGDRAGHGYGHDCRQTTSVDFWAGDVAVSESDAIFVARLSVPSAQVVTIIHQIVNGTAKVGEDYVTAAGTLQYASGDKEI